MTLFPYTTLFRSHIAAKLAKSYGLDALCLRAVQKWAARFRAGQHDIEDDDRSGRTLKRIFEMLFSVFLRKTRTLHREMSAGRSLPRKQQFSEYSWPRAEILQGPMDSAQAFRRAKSL
jgi:hypothetical protein